MIDHARTSARTATALGIVAACLCGGVAVAQVGPSTAVRPPSGERLMSPPRPGPRMVSPQARQPIQIARVDVKAEVVGQAARSQIEIVFKNPNAQVLEGELVFPLADGQSVSGFALNINGEMRPAVPVEKAKGQQVFEDVIRRGVDPALLEKTQGNNYKLRVYPLPAQGERRVSIELIETLPLQQGQALYRLPLQWPQAIGQVNVQVRLPGVVGRQVQAGRGLSGAELRPLGEAGGGSELVWRQTDFRAQQPVELSVNLGATPYSATQSFDGQMFFYAEVPLPAQPAAPAPRPQRLGLIWDASGSTAKRDLPRELALLDGLFKTWTQGSGQALTVDLVLARDTAQAPQPFVVRQGDWRELRTALERVAYDGATSANALVAVPGCDLNLLFSDGLSNFGPAVKALSTQAPLHAIQSSASADTAWLRHQAEASGGQLIDLTRTQPAAAIKRLTQGSIWVKDWQGAGVRDVVLNSRSPDSGRLQLAGVLTELQSTLRLTLISATGQAQQVQVPLRAQQQGALAASRWAAMTLDELEAQRGGREGDILRLGQRFGLASSQTSLIVLDSVNDYVTHEITPPSSLRASYEQMLARKWTQKRGADQQHLDQVAARFQRRLAWYERDHVAESAKRRAAAEEQRNAQRERAADAAAASANGMVASRPAPAFAAPSPAPAPVAPRAPAPAVRVAELSNHLNADAAKTVGETSSAPLGGPATLSLSTWQASEAFSRRMQAASAEEAYAIYLQERPSRSNSAAFFLESAEVFFAKGADALALRVLSNLAEISAEHRALMRVMAYRLQQAQRGDLALPVLARVKELAPNEPQSWRDWGLALAAQGHTQAAIDALWQVVSRPWDGRFRDVDQTALAELNALVALAPKAAGLDLSKIDPRLLKHLPLGLRIVLRWDADNTDMDLHVVEPSGEEAMFSHALTAQGGKVSADVTGGYGPEEYALRRPLPGSYKVRAKFYGHRQQTVANATTVQAEVTTGFGTPGQQTRLLTLRLSGQGDVVDIGSINVSP